MSLLLSIFSRFSNFFCTVICFVKVLVDSICQSKDLKNINLDICALTILTGKQFYLILYKIEAWLFLTFFLSFTQSINFYTFCCSVLKELQKFHILLPLIKGATKFTFVADTNYFCVCHKSTWKPNQHSRLLFLEINLHFETSD